MFRAIAHVLFITMFLLAALPAMAQEEPQDDDDEAEVGEDGGHPTADRFTFAARLGWTSRVGSTPSVDPFKLFPKEADPFDPMGEFTPPDFEAELRRNDQALPDTNPWGLHLGARGGYTLADDLLYLGGVFGYYLGDEELGMLPDGRASSTRVNIVTAGAELGIDAAVGSSILIRPFIGFGLSVGFSDICVDSSCLSGNEMQMFLNPGLGLIGFITDDIFVGAEVAMVGLTGPSRSIGADTQITGGLAL